MTDVPPGVITVTSTTPAACGGATAVIDVAEFKVKDWGAMLPKRIAEAPAKFVPVIVTDVPPNPGPLLGLSPVTVGAGTATNVYWSAVVRAEVPPAVVTVMSTTPAVWIGAKA